MSAGAGTSAGTGTSAGGRSAALLALALALTACGVPQDEQPRALQAREVPFASAPASPVPEPEGDVPVGLYFVRNGRVELVPRTVERSTSTAELVELLFRGPTQEESAANLINVIPSTLTVEDVSTTGSTAVITLAGPDTEVLRTPPLAFAQIVATLVPEQVDGVRFRLNGRDLPVPLADSSLTAAPLTRADYDELIAPGSQTAAADPAGPAEPAAVSAPGLPGAAAPPSA